MFKRERAKVHMIDGVKVLLANGKVRSSIPGRPFQPAASEVCGEGIFMDKATLDRYMLLVHTTSREFVQLLYQFNQTLEGSLVVMEATLASFVEWSQRLFFEHPEVAHTRIGELSFLMTYTPMFFAMTVEAHRRREWNAMFMHSKHPVDASVVYVAMPNEEVEAAHILMEMLTSTS